MTLRNALLATAMLALPQVVAAQPIDGMYISGGIGPNWLASTTVTTPSGSGHLATSLAGFGGFGSFGYGFANGTRIELEALGFSGSTKLNYRGGSTTSQNSTYGAMVNGLYDFSLGTSLTPYIGVGVGYVGVDEGDVSASRVIRVNSGAAGSFAVQGIVGLSYPLTPQLSVTAEYRPFDVTETRNYGATLATVGPNSHVLVKVGNELNHGFLVGLRYAFGAAAVVASAPVPEVIVAPAPPPARTYIVFFDWDKSDLVGHARQVISEAAKNATVLNPARISVAGHADKSGTSPYNQALSLRRANTVAAELVNDGVAKNEIVISAFGDTRPLVPTAAGVREPQNRRVEIVLQ